MLVFWLQQGLQKVQKGLTYAAGSTIIDSYRIRRRDSEEVIEKVVVIKDGFPGRSVFISLPRKFVAI